MTLEPFDPFEKAFEKYLEGHLLFSDLYQQSERMQAELTQLQDRFFYEFQFRSYISELQPLGQTAEDAFALLFSQLPQEESEADRELLEALKQTVHRLLEAFGQLRRWEEQQEKFSDSPFIHELIRVAYAVLEGHLPPEALAERLAGFRELFEEFRLRVEQNQGIPELADRQGEFQEALAVMDDGLSKIELFLAQQNEEELQQGLAELEEGSHLMVELYRFLESPPQARLRCVQCGLEQPLAKSCSQCHALLPQAAPEVVDATLDVRLGEQGLEASHGELPEALRRLVDEVETFRTGGQPEELGRVVETLRDRVNRFGRVVTRLAELEVPPEVAGQVQSVQGQAEQVVSSCQAGLEKIVSALETNDFHALDLGLETVLEGSRRARELQPLIAQLTR
ncbi:MAG: hypothetical protein AB7S38_20990 [Vulcanimicrobiota bacterium]